MISSKVTHNGPTSGLIAYWIAYFLLRLFGWDVIGQVSAGKKFVLIGAPHTSNWDFPFGLAAVYIYRLKVSWIGKESLFKKPFGGFMRFLGGIAINRDSHHGVVEQIAKKLTESRKLVIAMTPSGTRKKSDYWKSGFYRIAHAAQVPILCGYLDYAHRRVCIGLCFGPTGNVKEDKDRIRDFYKGIKGKYPEMTANIELRDENI